MPDKIETLPLIIILFSTSCDVSLNLIVMFSPFLDLENQCLIKKHFSRP